VNNKYLWLVAGIIIGMYVVPMIKAKTSSAGS
jgi:hypothetical protein